MIKQIEGSTQLLEELEQSTAEIKKDIASLYEEKEKLETSIENTDEQFKLDNVKKNSVIQADINLIKQAIRKAEKRLEEKTVENEDKAFNTAVELIKNYREEANEESKALNSKIVNHIEEIREMFAQLKDNDKLYQKEIMNLVNSLHPHFKYEEAQGGSILKTKYGTLRHTHGDRLKPLYRTSVLDIVDQRRFGIDGLLIEPRTNKRELEEKAKYMD